MWKADGLKQNKINQIFWHCHDLGPPITAREKWGKVSTILIPKTLRYQAKIMKKKKKKGELFRSQLKKKKNHFQGLLQLSSNKILLWKETVEAG